MAEEMPKEIRVARNSTRITWCVAIAAPLLTLLAAFLADDGHSHASLNGEGPLIGAIYKTIVLLPFIVVLPSIVLGYVLRSQRYKAWWYGDSVQPRGYILGNNALFALVQISAVLSTLSFAITGDAMPDLLPLLLCTLVMAVNFPHGKPMKSAPPQVGHGRHEDFDHDEAEQALDSKDDVDTQSNDENQAGGDVEGETSDEASSRG